MFNFNLKFTPDLVILLPFALMLNVTGLILVMFLLDDCGITDIIGMVVIFPLLFMKGQKMTIKSGGIMSKIKNFFTGKYLKFLTPLIGELTPGLGGIGFFWTMSVLCNLSVEEENVVGQKEPAWEAREVGGGDATGVD